jgi:hypothetical protein
VDGVGDAPLHGRGSRVDRDSIHGGDRDTTSYKEEWDV